MILQASTRFTEFLTTKISWSKNVSNESNCPDQITLPDMDPRTCVCMCLALFLEADLQYGDSALSQWLFCSGSTTNRSPTKEQDKEANRGKNTYARVLRNATKNLAFVPERSDNNRLGSHSIRKKAATDCREKGCLRDDLDYRAQWAAKQMQDMHVDSQLCWPDVNCASRLCFKGMCKHKIKEDAGLTDDLSLIHI